MEKGAHCTPWPDRWRISRSVGTQTARQNVRSIKNRPIDLVLPLILMVSFPHINVGSNHPLRRERWRRFFKPLCSIEARWKVRWIWPMLVRGDTSTRAAVAPAPGIKVFVNNRPWRYSHPKFFHRLPSCSKYSATGHRSPWLLLPAPLQGS